MEKNNRNGVGIFYGVIGVATLVVAVIGATFAYFTASANSANNAVTATSQNVKGTLTLTQRENLKDNLVPMLETDTNFKNKIGLDKATDCVDLNGNDICSVYEFTVTNGAQISQSISFTLTPTLNGFGNLYYAIFKGSPDTMDVNGQAASIPATVGKAFDVADGSLVVAKTPFPTGTSATSPILLSNLTQVLPAGEDVTYTLVLWIHEINDDQTDADSGKSFTAGINVGTGSANADGSFAGGITGVLGTAGQS